MSGRDNVGDRRVHLLDSRGTGLDIFAQTYPTFSLEEREGKPRDACKDSDSERGVVILMADQSLTDFAAKYHTYGEEGKG